MTATASKWLPAAPGTEEHFIIAKPDGLGSFARQLDQAFDHYETALTDLGLDIGSAVTATVFLSDSANQEGGLLFRIAVSNHHRWLAALGHPPQCGILIPSLVKSSGNPL